MDKKSLLSAPVEHVDISGLDAVPIIDAMAKMSFSARDTARAARMFDQMLADPGCTVILTLAGSAGAGGCLNIYADMIRYHMVDAVVATGAAIVDMDFFEALGFRHYQGTPSADDRQLRELYIDRIYDTYIDEKELQRCDRTIKEIADTLPPGVYSSRQFIREMGLYARKHGTKRGSLVEAALDADVPVFCPAFSDSSAGFGLVLHQSERPDAHVSIDSVRDFRELTEVKIAAGRTGLFMIGGGVPKNFAQDTVVCAEVLGREAEMHHYAVQITVADVRDGACSSSTLKEANSWGKVDSSLEQMVFAEATTVLPLIAAYVYQKGVWRDREPRRHARLFSDV